MAYVKKLYYKKCIHCNSPSNGKPYCYECYNKYYKMPDEVKEVIYNINPQQNKFDTQTNRTNEKKYKLANGTEVKSKSELLIGNYLINHHIRFEYEKPLKYSDNKRPLKPDFYIQGPFRFKGKWLKEIYIEHLGGAQSNDPEEQERYQNIIKYKMPIYKHKQITLICTYEEDLENLEEILTYKFKNYKENNINYFKES